MESVVNSYIEELSAEGKDAINGFLEIVGDKVEIENMMRDGIDMIAEETENKSITDEQIDHLQTMISEYLKGFVLAGYSYRGERVVLNVFKNAEQYDSNTVMANKILPFYVNNPMIEDEDIFDDYPDDGEY